MKRVWIQALLVNYLAVVQTRNAPADQEQPTAVHLSPSPRLRRLNQHHHKSHRITTRAAGRPRGLARVGEWPFFPASPLRCRAQQTTVNSSTALHPSISKACKHPGAQVRNGCCVHSLQRSDSMPVRRVSCRAVFLFCRGAASDSLTCWSNPFD